MTVAVLLGDKLRAVANRRPITDDEIQSWRSLQLLEGQPDFGFAAIESSALFNMQAFELVTTLLKARFPDFKVRPSVVAWVVLHSKARPHYHLMWAAIVASIFRERSSFSFNTRDLARRTLTMQDLAAFLGDLIPTDEHFDAVWSATELVNGKHELELDRNW